MKDYQNSISLRDVGFSTCDEGSSAGDPCGNYRALRAINSGLGPWDRDGCLQYLNQVHIFPSFSPHVTDEGTGITVQDYCVYGPRMHTDYSSHSHELVHLCSILDPSQF